jgi:KDO2-lipid IV(A) lauroyltransferase
LLLLWTNSVLVAVVNFIIRLTAVLPLGAVRFIGGLLGALGWLFNSSITKVTRKNIALCFPNMPVKEQATLVRQSMIESGITSLELLKIWGMSWDSLAGKIVNVYGRELIEEGVAAGKGVILVAPHLGNWEALGYYIAKTIQAPTILYKPPKRPELEQIIVSARSKLGAKIVPTNARGVMAVYKSLRKGGLTAILPDQEPDDDNSGQFAEFFGQQAFTMKLIHSLGSKSESRLLTTVALRVKGGFDIYFFEPDEKMYSADEATAIAALNRSVEAAVMMAPSQYQWDYKRFKSQPDRTVKLYKGSQ